MFYMPLESRSHTHRFITKEANCKREVPCFVCTVWRCCMLKESTRNVTWRRTSLFRCVEEALVLKLHWQSTTLLTAVLDSTAAAAAAVEQTGRLCPPLLHHLACLLHPTMPETDNSYCDLSLEVSKQEWASSILSKTNVDGALRWNRTAAQTR